MGLAYEKVQTKDGSFTLNSPLFDECYHSVHDGALNETLQKHVIPALRFCDKKTVKILDICFGLGFNTFATLYYIVKNNLDINVTIYAPEFDKTLLQSLKSFQYPKEFAMIAPIIDTVLEKLVYKDERFAIKIVLGDAREVMDNFSGLDIIYQDAFSPKKNPLLWTKEYFKQLFEISGDEVVLTTYSIATPVRLAMYEAGFRVYEYKSQSTRMQTLASKSPLPLKEIDLVKKLQNNPNAKSLRDSEFTQKPLE
ncbi:MAG: tRNA (5-methylaminomethyl-2-thiouridine)(34)-methyltransferase MnmD [Campylobacterota bacterium]